MFKRVLGCCTAFLLVCNTLSGITIVKANPIYSLNDGLILNYDFNQVKGDEVIDVSGNNNNGTWGSTASIVSDGKLGNALNLDGSSESYVKLPDNILNKLDDVTISTWVKFNETTNSWWQRIFDLGNDGDNFFFLSKNRACTLNVNKVPQGPGDKGILPDNKWVHVAITLSGQTMIYYENGVEVARKNDVTNKPSDIKTSLENYIGKSKFAVDPTLNGKIDDFRIYNRALVENDINDLMLLSLTDSEAVNMAKETLKIENLNAILSDVNLVTSTKTGVAITWSSDNKQVISDDGKVTRPDGDKAIVVKLIATITKGTAIDTKVFEANVQPKSISEDLTKGLVLHYDFDEAKGDKVIDMSGNENNGTWEGSADTTSDGKLDSALNLDGNGYVKLPDNLMDNLDDITISTWVNFNKTDNSFWQRIFDLGNDTTNCFFLSKNRVATLNINGKNEGTLSNSIIPDNQWIYLAVTLSGGTMIYYENGVEMARLDEVTNKPSDIKSSIENYIGKSKYAADAPLNGKVDEFRIYNRALSEQEITGLMTVKNDELKQGLLLNYNFDQEKGTTVNDISGNNNNGTWGGSADITADGKSGFGLNLDGNGYVKLPNNIFKDVKDITISTWVNLSETDTNAWWQRIYDFGTDETNFMYFAVNRAADMVSKGKGNFKTWNDRIPAGQWIQLTVTLSGSTMVWYENGVEIQRQENITLVPNDLEPTTANYIGKSKFSADPSLNGKLDDFKIYNRALSLKEIKQLMLVKSTDANAVAKAKSSLSIGDLSEVVSDLQLPSTEENGTTITWSSDNKAIINDNGKVIRPDGDKVIIVNLTATIKKGVSTDTKVFEAKVLPKNLSNYTLNVDVSKPKFEISDMLVGLFFEDINHGADGGLYSDLVENNSFEFGNSLESWILENNSTSKGDIIVKSETPLNTNNTHYGRLNATVAGDGVRLVNDGYKGITVKEDSKYDFSVWARSKDGLKGNLMVQLEDKDGNIISDVVTIKALTKDWTKYESVLTAKVSTSSAKLVVYTKGTGTIDLDMISIFPQDTWKDRKYGLREDLVQMLDDMKPKFLRFPGGCIIEGDSKENMYNWKDTIGNIEERKVNRNLWGYYQSYGLGFYEYFQLCEDLGSVPVPVVNVGMTCQARGVNGVSNYMASLTNGELDKYIQDALDLIEYANGDSTTTWGAKRIASGHPESFNLKYLSVGNEQWGNDYFVRFEAFQKVLKEKHPEITLISSAGPVSDGPLVTDAWNWVREKANNTVVDEHYYMSPDWFLNNTHRYDSYDRNGAKVFLGEYASQSNTMKSALSEAAYLTGIEKNSDLVKMTSYAPMFAKADDFQWSPNMIWFNGSEAYGTPNYYVQKLFSTNTGTHLLESSVDRFKPISNNEVAGGIILGSWLTGVEYDDVKVTNNDDNSTIFSDDFSTVKPEWKKGTGNWTVKDGKLVITDKLDDCRTYIENTDWANYTLSVKAKRTSGSEGFLIGVGAKDTKNFYWLNVGGWANTRTVLEKAVNGTKSVVSEGKHSKVEDGKEYDIKVEVNGSSIKCYIDGVLTNEFFDGKDEQDVYTSTSFDNNTNEVIVKIVNTTEMAKNVKVNLNGIKEVLSEGTEEVLSSDSQKDENSFENKTKASTVKNKITGLSTNFTHEVKKNSVTVLRIKTKDDVKMSMVTVSGEQGVTQIDNIGGTLQMSALVDNVKKEVVWSVTDVNGNNTDIATIDSNGLLKAEKVGDVMVVATLKSNSAIKGTTKVNITQKVNSITLTGAEGKNTISVKGGTLQILPVVAPSNAVNKSIVWSLETVDRKATDIGTIDGNGNVKARKNGTIYVVATAKDGSGTISKMVVTISGQTDVANEKLEAIAPKEPTETIMYDVDNINNDSDWGSSNTHDPSIYKDGDWYYVFSTDYKVSGEAGVGLQVRKSKDLINWQFVGRVFDSIPASAKEWTPKASNMWAPDVTKIGDTYYLYYAVSEFGTNTSFMGVATSKSIEGPWVDQGEVYKTNNKSKDNAIDPNIATDANGDLWMSYGSYFGGIFISKIDKTTGKFVTPGPGKQISATGTRKNMEAPYIIYNPEFKKYYLFMSYDSLGGASSTGSDYDYNIRMGWSDNIDGPYTDLNGNSLMDTPKDHDELYNIGTKLIGSYSFGEDAGWLAPGHNSVLNDNGDFYLVHHARGGENGYWSYLNVRKIVWTEDGKPMVSPERYAGEKEQKIDKSLIPGKWQTIVQDRLFNDKIKSTDLTLYDNGKINDENGKSYWEITGDNILKLYYYDSNTDSYKIDTVKVLPAWDWENWNPTVVFTGYNEDNTAIWGKQVTSFINPETPGTGTETPGTGTETPGTGTETPGTGTETPGTGTETPGTGTETPGTGTETPGTGTETPGTGTEAPGTGTETPGTGTDTEKVNDNSNDTIPKTGRGIGSGFLSVIALILIVAGTGTIFLRKRKMIK